MYGKARGAKVSSLVYLPLFWETTDVAFVRELVPAPQLFPPFFARKDYIQGVRDKKYLSPLRLYFVREKKYVYRHSLFACGRASHSFHYADQKVGVPIS